MKAKDIMTTNVVTVSADADVRTIARRLIERGVSAVPVVDSTNRVIGIVSEGDLMRRSESGTERHPSWWLRFVASAEDQAREFTKSHGMKAADVMTREVVTIAEDTPLDEIATTLERHHIKRVPVVRDEQVVGIVSRANLLHGLATGKISKHSSADDGDLRESIRHAMSEAGIRTTFLDVVVSDGVAHLWGAVESDAEKRAAQVAAESTDGVKRVEDNINVMPQMVRSVLWAE